MGAQPKVRGIAPRQRKNAGVGSPGAPPPPPGAPPPGASPPPPPPGVGDDDDDDYDPFAEEPAPHVAAAAGAPPAGASTPPKAPQAVRNTESTVGALATSRPTPPWRSKTTGLPPPPAWKRRLEQRQAAAAAAAAQLASVVPQPLPLPELVPLPPPPAKAVPAAHFGRRGRKRTRAGAAVVAVAAADPAVTEVAALPKASPVSPAESAETALAAPGAPGAAAAPGAGEGGPPNELVAAEAAALWLSRRGPSRRQVAAAKIAEEYFKPEPAVSASASTLTSSGAAAEAQPAKRSKETRITFTPDLLAKAPGSIQTCQSLSAFLAKKLEELVPEPPAVNGPQALVARLEAFASLAGRVAVLQEKSGWDARARRVLDVSAATKLPSGESAMAAAGARVEAEGAKLSEDLRAKGEEGGLQTLVAERRQWAQAQLRRDWWAWCRRLLSAKEAALLSEAKAEAKAGAAGATETLATVRGSASEWGLGDVLEALLAGRCPPAA